MRQTRNLAMTPELRDAIGLLRCSNAALADRIAELAAGNPRVEIVPPVAAQRDAVWQALEAALDRPGGTVPRPPRGAGIVGGAGDATDRLAAAPAGLADHARREVGLILRDPVDRAIAEHFINALEPSGWLGAPLADIAAEAGCTLARAEAVLAQIQQAEPAGLFARSLAECLALQAREAGVMTPAFAVVLDNLALLARGDLAALARLAGGDEAQVRDILAQIRGFDPKPGARFDPDPQPLRDPDVTVRRRADGWLVEMTRSTLPGVMVRDAGAGAEDEALRAARWLERAVARRNDTALRITQAVVERQRDWLDHGPGRLQPMALADLAGPTGLHESTISRVTAGLLLATPRGMVALRDLFGPGLPLREGGVIAARAVRHRIVALIRAEVRAAPLSDGAIADLLAAEGIVLARRTVAKYREAEGIAPAPARRRAARIAPRR
ncbi:RNA polymerase factor sigma-54 [Phaeovulum sp. NW3]|nr:RNA polymerase factor sigma-54 [Phaeovulum sp. NW3]